MSISDPNLGGTLSLLAPYITSLSSVKNASNSFFLFGRRALANQKSIHSQLCNVDEGVKLESTNSCLMNGQLFSSTRLF